MEFSVPCGTKIPERLVDQGIQEASYLCCFNNIVADFEEKKQDLVAKLEGVQNCTNQGTNQTDNILPEVERWLDKTRNLIEAERLIEEDNEKKRTCFFGCFPNCIWRYSRGKDLVTKTKDINQLITECNELKNYPLSLPSKIPDVEYHSSEHFVPLQSRNLAYNQLLEALKHGNNYVVGLQGIGGAGKTTLAIQVGKEVKKAKLFEYVIEVTVSNTPDIKNIQHEIARPLGLKLEEDLNELDRAKKLWQRLTDGEKILIILDDVWEKLDFGKIGIPSSSNHNSCRVLLTTRDVKVCKSMGCSTRIELDILSEQDAWVLFQKYAGLGEDSPHILKNKGREITKECKGLPVAITVIASTLKDEEKEEWDLALISLKRIGDKDEDLIKVYKCLQVSYDYLKSKEAQELFLLCSVFPDDYEISVEDLTLYAIGLGLCKEVNSFEDARVSLHRAKKKLMDCCLLQKVKKESVKMHDLLRDMAHWLEKGKIQVIMEPGRNLNALQREADEKESSLRYLYSHNINDLPDLLDYPKLEILILEFDYKISVINIPDAFFERMKDLKVCTLSCGTFSSSLLKSFEVLKSSKSLRTLTIRRLSLGDISGLEKLQMLESLRFEGCSINEVPSGIEQLKKLKLLSLIKCIIRKNPYGVMEQIVPQLEELYFMGNDISYRNVDNEVITRFLNKSPPLKRYQIDLAKRYELMRSVHGSTSRALSIAHFCASTSNPTVKDLMKRAEILHLNKLQGGYKTIIPGLVEAIGDINELIEIALESCSEIEFLVDTIKGSSSVGTVFSAIVNVYLTSMNHLKALCYGPPPSHFFENLQELKISTCPQLNFTLLLGNLQLKRLKLLHLHNCPMLTLLITLSIAQSLVLLEELNINTCKSLKSIITNESEEKGKEIVENVHDQLRLFPELKSLGISDCPQFEGLMSMDVTASLESQVSDSQCSHPFDTPQCLLRPSLISGRNIGQMHIINCHKLKSLFVASVLQTMQLKKLYIESCDGLEQIIIDDSNHHDDKKFYESSMPELRYLSIYRCSQLKYVFGQTHHEKHLSYPYSDIQIQINFPALEVLKFSDLPNLISICQNNYHPKMLALKEFNLMECPQFTITAKDPGMIMGHTDTLKRLKITTSQIEGIFCLEGLGDSGQHVISRLNSVHLADLSGMSYMSKGPKHMWSLENLTGLFLQGCQKLKVIISTSMVRSLPQLQMLTVADCGALEQIVEEDVENENISNPFFKQVCFPELTSFVVKNCSELKRLWCMDTPNEFPKLEKLVIMKALNLKEIFGSSDQCGREEAMEKDVLPKLNLVILVELPSLTDVWPYKLRTVENRFVLNCPSLSVTSTLTVKDFKWSARRRVEIDLLRMYHERLLRSIEEYIAHEADSEKKSGSQVLGNDVLINEASLADQQHANGETKDLVMKVLKEPISDAVQDYRSTKEVGERLEKPSNVAQKTSLQALLDKESNKETITINSMGIGKAKSDIHSDDSQNVIQPSIEGSVEECSVPHVAKVVTPSESGRSNPDMLVTTSCGTSSQEPVGSIYKDALPEDRSTNKTGERLEKPQVAQKTSSQSTETSVEEGPMPHIVKIVTSAESERSSPHLISASKCQTSSQDFVETDKKLEKPPDAAKETSLQGFVDKEPKEPLSNQEDRSANEAGERLEKSSNVAQNISLQDKDGETMVQNVQEIANPPPVPIELVEEVSGREAITMDRMAIGKPKFDIHSNDSQNNIRESVQEGSISQMVEVVTSSEEERKAPELFAFQCETSPQDFIEKGPKEFMDGVQEDKGINQAGEGLEKPSNVAQKSSSQVSIKGLQMGTYLDEDTNSLDLRYLVDDILSLYDSVEKDSEVEEPTSSASVIPSERHNLQDNQLVAEALADLETYLNFPLEGIANLEFANSRLEKALKFLSSWSSGNGASFEALKATIDSLLQNLPSILSSFKEASATIDKFTVLEEKQKSYMEELPQRKEAANALEKSTAEAYQKEADLEEKFCRVQAELKSIENERKEHGVHLSSLKEQGKKLYVDAVCFSEEFKTIKKDKSEMEDDRSKAHEQIRKAKYEWTAFSSQLKTKCSASRNLF